MSVCPQNLTDDEDRSTIPLMQSTAHQFNVPTRVFARLGAYTRISRMTREVPGVGGVQST